MKYLIAIIALLSFGAQASEPRISEANYPKMERFMLTILCVNSHYLPARAVHDPAMNLAKADKMAFDIYREDGLPGVLIYIGPDHAAELMYYGERSIYYPAATAQMCITINGMTEQQYADRNR